MNETLAATTEEQTTAAQIAPTPCFEYAGKTIPLNPGERYVGTIISADHTHNHHIILLPGDADDAPWQAQMEWAKAQGGELPDRTESALLFSTLKDEFKPDWYWTRDPHASHSGYAWCQIFYSGDQGYGRKDVNLRARAVRRLLVIQ